MGIISCLIGESSLKILNSDFKGSIAALIIQQLMVALSTYFIANLGSSAAGGGNIVLPLCLFLGLSFFVFIPEYFAKTRLKSAKNNTIKKYIETFSDVHHDKPEMYTDNDKRKEFAPWVTNQVTETVEEVYNTIYQGVSDISNITFNTIALSIAVDPYMVPGYFVGGCLLLGTAIYYKNPLEKSADTAQSAKLSFNSNLSIGWDNITIGNRYNLSLWNKKFSDLWKTFNSSSLKEESFTQRAASIGMLVTLVPIAGNIAYLFIADRNNPVKMAAYISTLPRQVVVVQNVQYLATAIVKWPGIYQKYCNLNKSLEKVTFDVDTILFTRIHGEIVCFQDKKRLNEVVFKELKNDGNVAVKENPNVVAFNKFKILIEDSKKGRFTIQGKNKAGKSTVLCLLKSVFGNNALYLPPNSKLLFNGTDNQSFSTGEAMISNLTEIFKGLKQGNQLLQPDGQKELILLLDEWQANLDEDNAEELSQQINEIAKSRVVVEVIHDKPKILLDFKELKTLSSPKSGISRERKEVKEVNTQRGRDINIELNSLSVTVGFEPYTPGGLERQFSEKSDDPQNDSKGISSPSTSRTYLPSSPKGLNNTQPPPKRPPPPRPPAKRS